MRFRLAPGVLAMVPTAVLALVLLGHRRQRTETYQRRRRAGCDEAEHPAAADPDEVGGRARQHAQPERAGRERLGGFSLIELRLQLLFLLGQCGTPRLQRLQPERVLVGECVDQKQHEQPPDQQPDHQQHERRPPGTHRRVGRDPGLGNREAGS
jgi:hypothetical protein